MRKFAFMRNINFRINLILIATAVCASISVFIITYSLLHNAVVDDIRERADRVNAYVQSILLPETFSQLNTAADESNDLYIDTHELMDTARTIANIKYLYTAKLNEANELIYVIDGLNYDNEDFRHPGDLIEPELIEDLTKCLQGDTISSPGVLDTEWGYVYALYIPVKDELGQVIGALGMEFDADYITASYQKAGIFSLLLSGVLTLVVLLLSHYALKRVSEPFYKKLAYTDILTGIPNRMAFEEKIKDCEAALKEQPDITLLIFDLNDLKTVNDQLGHSAGDEYLKKAALQIQHAFKPLGQTYRIGGDEIATILINCPKEQVEHAIEALYQEEDASGQSDSFNCAYGMAAFCEGKDQSLHDVFSRADNNMYEHKRKTKKSREVFQPQKAIVDNYPC